MDMNLCRLLLMLVCACVVTFSCLLGPVDGQQDGGHGFHYTREYLLSCGAPALLIFNKI